MLTSKQSHDLFNYIDGKLYWKKSPCNRVDLLKPSGSIRSDGYINIQIKGVNHYAHKVIFLMFHGYNPKEVDHINNKNTDNRIENLRPANHSQNQQNSLTNKNNTSGVKGVVFCKNSNKWKAQIRHNKRQLHVGYYKDINEAEACILKKRALLHKEYANNG